MGITTLLLFYREINTKEKPFPRFLATMFMIIYYSSGDYKEQLSYQSAWQVSQCIEETNLQLTAFFLAKNRCSLAWPLLCLLPILNHSLLFSM